MRVECGRVVCLLGGGYWLGVSSKYGGVVWYGMVVCLLGGG